MQEAACLSCATELNTEPFLCTVKLKEQQQTNSMGKSNTACRSADSIQMKQETEPLLLSCLNIDGLKILKPRLYGGRSEQSGGNHL